MSGRQLYLVRWDRRQDRSNGATASRIFRQRQAAVRWMLTMRREGKAAELYAAPMPEWALQRMPEMVARRHAAFVNRRVKLRAIAREKWGKS